METPELYIPPCCIDKQLPGLIREAGPNAVWYSQGDWGLSRLTHSVETLVPSYDQKLDTRHPVVTALVMTDASLPTLRYIQKELRMRWSSVVILVTGTDRTKMLQDNLSEAELQRIWYCPNRIEAHHDYCNLWLRWSPAASLLITGPMSDSEKGVGRFCCYTSSFFENIDPPSSPDEKIIPGSFLRRALAPWRSMLRLHATIRGGDPQFQDWI